ncbi:3-hydroxyacyl-CoA dehydrogenase [Strigomonas culicis]|uniref:3-hydroxyacyl-CoA dehydrogenase n=1 Tax=Strigomonas culicis TaxID=28005 RepID=S9V7L3_9TRYP|nr:3-hydroxyacyl-CoA dehydrogenase [Strigomonas culicis]|eukprot:EPY22946.1 3-hydroxyacyl-CoA dehydrogenase [Strigomonas culicis]
MERAKLLYSHLQTNNYVRTERHGAFFIIQLLNHAYGPAVGGALSSFRRVALLGALREAEAINDQLDAAAAAPAAKNASERIRYVLLTSEDPRIFSIGVNPECFADGLYDTEAPGHLDERAATTAEQAAAEQGQLLRLLRAQGTAAEGVDAVDAAHVRVPSLRTLAQVIENCSIPVVAAVQGICASWAVELILACHYRVAGGTARMRFPDVFLGLVPCGGGALRLARLVGLRHAIDMLCTGRKVGAAQAKRMGLVDAVVHVDAPPGAVGGMRSTFLRAVQQLLVHSPSAQRHIAERMAVPPSAKRAEGGRAPRVGFPVYNAALFAWIKHRIHESASYEQRAPFFPLELMQLVCQHGHEPQVYYAKEQTFVLSCLGSKEAKASQHVMRGANGPLRQWLREHHRDALTASLLPSPQFTYSQPVPSLRSIVIIGAGTMGTSIAMTLLHHLPHKHVTFVEIDESRQRIAQQGIRDYLDLSMYEGRMTALERQHILARLRFAGSGEDPLPRAALSEADLVIECTPEVTALKERIFANIDPICKPSCVFATGMSTRLLHELAQLTSRPSRFLGLHFYPPANETPLVEIASSSATDPAVMRYMVELMLRIHKHPIITCDRPGYGGARMLRAGLYQAYAMVEDGSFPYEVDRTLKKVFHFRFGIFELEDLVGLDVNALARHSYFQQQRLSADSGAMPEVVTEVLRRAQLPPVAAAAPLPHRAAGQLPPRDVFTVADELVKRGRLGRKSGEGWYRYAYNPLFALHRRAQRAEPPLPPPAAEGGAAAPPARSSFAFFTSDMVDTRSRHALLSIREMQVVHNREVEFLVLANSKRKSIMRRDIADKELVERILLVMINEAAQLLSEHYVKAATDVDCLTVFGFGFPAWKGGLLYYADRVWGIAKVVTLMKMYHRALSAATFPWPCSVLLEMEACGDTFASRFPQK